MGAMSAFTVGMIMYPGVPLVRAVVIALAAHLIYLYQGLAYRHRLRLWLSNVFTVDIALILIAIPQVRNWAIATIRGEGTAWQRFIAFYVVFFAGSTFGIQLNWVPSFATNPWPAEVWPPLIVIIFLERVVFTAVGAIIAVALIGGAASLADREGARWRATELGSDEAGGGRAANAPLVRFET